MSSSLSFRMNLICHSCPISTTWFFHPTSTSASGWVSVPKPLSQIQRSTRWLLQGLSPRPSFGGFGLMERSRCRARFRGLSEHQMPMCGANRCCLGAQWCTCQVVGGY